MATLPPNVTGSFGAGFWFDGLHAALYLINTGTGHQLTQPGIVLQLIFICLSHWPAHRRRLLTFIARVKVLLCISCEQRASFWSALYAASTQETTKWIKKTARGKSGAPVFAAA